jgi:hypothetical protein
MPESKDMPQPNLRKALPGNARYGQKTSFLSHLLYLVKKMSAKIFAPMQKNALFSKV